MRNMTQLYIISCLFLTIICTNLMAIDNGRSLVSGSNSFSNKNNNQPLAEWLVTESLGRNEQLFRYKSPITPSLSLEREQALNGKSDAIATVGGPDFEPTSCQLAKVVLILQRPGCQPKAISSFACTGSCPSYVQVSKAREWKHERSCSCCQQTAVQEDTFVLDCPALTPPYREVKTYAPVNCICRSCSDMSREYIKPQELVEALEGRSTTD